MVQELPPDFLKNVSDIRISPHPIFRLFSDGESPLHGNVIIERYLAVESVSDPSVNVWATLRNGAPLVLEKTFGAGRTMTFLTSASPAWNNWGRNNPSYVVVLLELTAWLSKRVEQLQMLTVGDPLTVSINPMEFEERVQFGLSQERVLPHNSPPSEGQGWLPLEGGNHPDILRSKMSPLHGRGIVEIDAVPTENGFLLATFTQTDHPGFYQIIKKSRSGAELSELKAVNVNTSEGDIRQLDVTEIADILRPVRQTLETAAGFSTASDFGGRQSVSDWLLVLAILFLLGETILAGRILPPS
jgi:hypothetical protein